MKVATLVAVAGRSLNKIHCDLGRSCWSLVLINNNTATLVAVAGRSLNKILCDLGRSCWSLVLINNNTATLVAMLVNIKETPT